MLAFIERSPTRVAVLLAFSIGLLFFSNAILFTWFSAIPLPSSDAWYFISAFLPKVLDGTFVFQDLFMQRDGGVDHAQPLQKLILLGHLYFADLDFRIEAVVGVSAAFALCLLLAIDMIRAGKADLSQATFGVAALFLIGSSLNSTSIYTWSLVTLGWMMLLVVVVFFRSLDDGGSSATRGFIKGFAITLSAGLVVDELIFPAVIALVLARALYEPKQLSRKSWWASIAGIIIGLISARVLIGFLSPIDASSGTSIAKIFSAFGGWSGIWAVLNGVLGDGLVHRMHRSSGDLAPIFSAFLIAIMTLGHIAFWWRVLVSRRLPSRRISVVSIALMLLFYAMAAGILISRVPSMGLDYVHQPRYVLFYQVGVIAWILLFLTPVERAVRWTSARQWSTPAVFLCLLITLQAWLSWQAWSAAPHLRAYVVNADRVILDLAETNEVPEAGCPDILTICDASSADRASSLDLMRDHRLSVFSPDFRERNGFESLEQSRANALSPDSYACTDIIEDWGPRIIVIGEPFNVQANGNSTYWISLSLGASLASILTDDGAAVSFVQSPGLVSFSHTPDLAIRSSKAMRLALQLRCSNGTEARLSIPVEQPAGI